MRRTLLVLLMLAVAVPLLAQSEGEEPGRAQAAVIRFLQLAPEQVEQWNALLEAREAAMVPLKEQLQAVNEQLDALLDGEAPDPTQVGALVIQGRDLRQAMGAVHRTYVEGFEALLDEEQVRRLAGLRRAEQLQPLFPAFRLFGLLPPAGAGPGPR